MSLQNPLDTELARRGGVNGLIASIKKVLAFYFLKPTGKSTDYIRGDGSIAPFPTVSGSTYNPTAGTGISITGTSPNQTITNTLPDQTVVMTAGTGISITGTYPSFTITNTGGTGGGVERRNDWQSPYSYCGSAPTGSAESSPVWDIYRVEVFTDGTVNVMSAIGVAWTNRYSVIYT